MIAKTLEKITPDDLNALVENGVAESRSLDYKQELPGRKDSEKKEFLFDVCALANSGGGDLVYGVVEASGGVPQSVEGLVDAENHDGLQLAFRQSIRDCIEPRVAVSTKMVPGFPSGPVLVLRVHASWAAPHMVTFKGTSRFYARSGSGKYQMDHQQIRDAFLLSSRIEEKIRGFRDQRLSLIESGEAPANFPSGPKLVLHSIPFQSVAPGSSLLFEVAELRTASTNLKGALRSTLDPRPNLDGWLLHAQHYGQTVQMFRNGVLEFVDGEPAQQMGDLRHEEERWLLPGNRFGADVVEVAGRFLKTHEAMGLGPPSLLLISLLGTRGCGIASQPQIRTFDREVGPLPDVLVDEFGADVRELVRPVLDIVWQAAGFQRCYLFDEQGNWKG